jgi:hypothetical protein
MSNASAPASPLEVTTPPLPLVAAAPAAAALAPALPAPALPALALPAPPLPVPTARTVGNLQIACKYSCFPFADGMLTLTDGFRTLSRC